MNRMSSLRRRLGPIGLAWLVAAAVAAAAVASAAATVHVRAELRSSAVVPRPVGALRASGSFSATFPAEGARPRLLWTIIFGDLTGPAVEADLHVGRPAVAGGVLFPLCRPCKSGQSGSTKLTQRGVRLIESGRTYVELRTPKNPAGEIRGQVLVR